MLQESVAEVEIVEQGWSHKKREAVELAFYRFLRRCYVNSKDAGRICLGDSLYQGQVDCITEIFDALEEGIHEIYILKSRQLGISTIIRALTVFLLGIHKGLKGAIVFDTDPNKSESRAELEIMIEDLPDNLKFPKVKSSNRAGLTLDNDSKVLFMSAGVKKTKTSGTLGRSVGLSIAHCSELCSWDNDDGLEAFRNSLSDINPDRLYIYESTARGPNKWKDMWDDARLDPKHCRCIFLGWWSKNSQRIERTQTDWLLYGEQAPTDKELAKIQQVRELYGHEVTPEQLAWVRRKMDPTAHSNEKVATEWEGSPTRIQEQPWTEDEAFQLTGSIFFTPEVLTDHMNRHVDRHFQAFMFTPGGEFPDMLVHKATTIKSTELKVWEEPEPHSATYVLGLDPAFGHNELNDRSAIEVFRCYADGVDQVAEYAWPLITTRQLAWVAAALMGWYGGSDNEVRYVLELNGPGEAVFNELRSLRTTIENDRMLRKKLDDKGLRNIFDNVRTYIFNRTDAMGAGYNYHLKTTTQIKITLLERLRDWVQNGHAHIRSLSLIEEMRTIARDGDSIGAQGSMKDDRVLAASFAVHCWEEKVRRTLIASNKSREAEKARKEKTITDQVALFQSNMLTSFFGAKRQQRQQQVQLLQRQHWRYGTRRW